MLTAADDPTIVVEVTGEEEVVAEPVELVAGYEVVVVEYDEQASGMRQTIRKSGIKKYLMLTPLKPVKAGR